MGFAEVLLLLVAIIIIVVVAVYAYDIVIETRDRVWEWFLSFLDALGADEPIEHPPGTSWMTPSLGGGMSHLAASG